MLLLSCIYLGYQGVLNYVKFINFSTKCILNLHSTGILFLTTKVFENTLIHNVLIAKNYSKGY